MNIRPLALVGAILLGLLLIGLSLIGSQALVFAVMLGGIVVVLVVAFAYSYQAWSAVPDRRETDGSTA